MAIDLRRTRPFMSYPLSRAVDRLFEHAFAPFYGGRDGGAESSGQTGVQTLPVTIWETGDALHAALMAPGLDETTPTLQAACSDEWTCLELAPVTLTPPIEVAGVQTSADDARQAGEADPFIINDGFGD